MEALVKHLGVSSESSSVHLGFCLHLLPDSASAAIVHRFISLLLMLCIPEELIDIWKAVLKTVSGGFLDEPKTHMILHMILRSRDLGNPRFYSAFLDESLNKTLKRSLKLVHQSCFETMGYVKTQHVLDQLHKRFRVA